MVRREYQTNIEEERKDGMKVKILRANIRKITMMIIGVDEAMYKKKW